jgi:predicted CXXCH cytochrome family protein
VKKVSLILAMAAIVVLATAGSAFANFGPHGGYALDTDACAGCHRAHTSFSDLTWQDTGGNNHSALLVSSASTMQEFCYACHGDNAPGASTNVQMGVFDSGPSGADGVTGPGVAYQTNSAFNGALNGGGFQSMPATNGVGFTATSSMHDMEKGSLTDPMWGAGSSAPAGTNLTCTTCHDPHGSSNYRILKDSVNGVTVGGYNGETPQPFVFSSEEGYPAGGWLKHIPGASQMETYFPNYTTAEYKFAMPDPGYSPGQFRTMSTWCSACHQQYDNKQSTYNYGGYEAVDATRVAGVLTPGVGTAVGDRNRHRHPVNIPIATVTQLNGWGSDAITSTILPLDKRLGAPASERGTWRTTDYLGCLTCHRAHGAQTTMNGWAVSSLANNPSAVVTWYPTMATAVGPSGVNPNFSSALLRADNRGVCERCHNK